MKGVVIEYFEEKGFGFIRDEQDNRRFFHISNIKDKVEFLNNVIEFYYTEVYERVCYVVDFTPSKDNQNRLNALNINLTDEILNDKSAGVVIEAKINGIKYDVQSLTRTVQGVKKGESPPMFATAGGNGTFRIGYPEYSRELTIDFTRVDDIGWGIIQARDQLLSVNNRTKVTDSLLEAVQRNLTGKRINVMSKNNEWILQDASILKI